MLESVSSIPWTSDLDAAFDQARIDDKLVLVEFSQAPRCAGSMALRSEVYSDSSVVEFIVGHFVPVSLIRSDSPNETARFNVVWTPTLVLTEPNGIERHRTVGFLPRNELLGQLELGVSKAIFGRARFVDAQGAFTRVEERYRDTYAGPEAAYWSGVSLYKQDKNRDFLRLTALRLGEEYPNTEWAVKASVWLGNGSNEKRA